MTKRFGIVAASQLPLHYLLAAKSWSPLHYLLRMSHEELNPYHRLLGRILIAFFSAHAIFYINFYIQSDLLHRFRSQTVILGLIAIGTFVLIGTSSLQWLRDKSYLLFFILHVTLSMFLLPILWFHVTHLRVYVVEAALVYILMIAQRRISQTPTLASLSLLPSSGKAHGLLEISFPLPRSKLRNYKPGHHIYLGLPPDMPRKPWEKLRFNPFTIASSSAINNSNNNALSASATTQPTTGNAKTHTSSLLIRPMRSSTAVLASIAESSKNQPTPVLIEGPYGSTSYFPDLSSSRFSRILLVAGGVGATFTLPIYRDLLVRRNGHGVRFVWSVRGQEEAAWALDSFLNDESEAVIDIHLTTDTSPSTIPSLHNQTPQPTLPNTSMSTNDEDNTIELEERTALLSHSQDDEGKPNPPKLNPGRPDLCAIVKEVFEDDEEGEGGKIAVLICGPGGMGKVLRAEVGKWVKQGRDVFWHAEQFGW
ncbi:MAG: hypothetical protein Q9191_002317 [Dirinaria sp. TL-2023a]